MTVMVSGLILLAMASHNHRIQRDSLDLLIDKQELIRNKVLEANSLCGSDTMNVSGRRQFESKIPVSKKAKKNGGYALIERPYHTNIFKERNPQKIVLIS